MSCGEANGALLDSLEAQSRLVAELRSSRLDSAWRAELLEQADRGLRSAFCAWRAHLALSIDLDIESSGAYATIAYGGMLRILPLPALRSERALLLVAEALWDGEHRRPVSEEWAYAWLQAREAGVSSLAEEIGARFADTGRGLTPRPPIPQAERGSERRGAG